MNIYGKKVILRAMEKEDCELVREMFNDPEIENLVVGWAFPLSRYSQEKWFESHHNDHNFRFIIETNEDGAVGVATLLDIDWKNRMLLCRTAGYSEIITYSFISPTYYDKIGLSADSPLRNSLKILNPHSLSYSSSPIRGIPVLGV